MLKILYVIQHNLKTFSYLLQRYLRESNIHSGFLNSLFIMTNLIKKAANALRTANYCIARAELYLNEAKCHNEK